ncbi:MAG: DUF922 domain-containing protein [Alphaproteobacteria bacterium]
MVLKQLILLSLLLTAFPRLCHAAVQENISYDYYSVTVAQGTLHEALVAAYPLQKPGERHHAFTNWRIDWHFDWAGDGGDKCSMSSVETTLTVTMTLPKIVSASPAIDQQFDDYFPKLKVHEDGHLEIARNAANSIDSALAGIRGVACSLIADQGNKTAHDILDRAIAAEKDYDTRTEHGKTQGAYLGR